MEESDFVPLEFRPLPLEQMRERSAAFYEEMRRRRTVRTFSDRPVERQIIENCIRTAATAPSGANQQPWHFVAVTDLAVKGQIREAAEREEYEFYHGLASEEWLDALKPLGTDWHKPFLEIAPWLIVLFGQAYGLSADGGRYKHYYMKESVGIAAGMLIAAVHHAGLACLTHTPAPMGFLSQVLHRPENERAFLILVVGYPAEGTKVPDIQRKELGEVATFT